MPVGLQALAPLVLRHFETTFLLKITHDDESGPEKLRKRIYGVKHEVDLASAAMAPDRPRAVSMLKPATATSRFQVGSPGAPVQNSISQAKAGSAARVRSVDAAVRYRAMIFSGEMSASKLWMLVNT